jgi:hypothetical protein
MVFIANAFTRIEMTSETDKYGYITRTGIDTATQKARSHDPDVKHDYSYNLSPAPIDFLHN